MNRWTTKNAFKYGKKYIGKNLLTLKDISTGGAEEQHLPLLFAAGPALWNFPSFQDTGEWLGVLVWCPD